MWNSLGSLVDAILTQLNSVVLLLSSVAFLLFLAGCIRLIYNAGSEAGFKRDRRILTWGLVALFVLMSVWGIVAMIQTAVLPNAGPTPSSGPQPASAPAFPTTART